MPYLLLENSTAQGSDRATATDYLKTAIFPNLSYRMEQNYLPPRAMMRIEEITNEKQLALHPAH